jgi:hypothetical protein
MKNLILIAFLLTASITQTLGYTQTPGQVRPRRVATQNNNLPVLIENEDYADDKSQRKLTRARNPRHSSGNKSIRRNTSLRRGRTGGSYTNIDRERVRSPRASRSAPRGASALCGDGSYSFSRHARGTCSHHGGVARWL